MFAFVLIFYGFFMIFFFFKLRADLMTQLDRHAFIFIFPFVLLFIAIFRGRLEAEQLCASEAQRSVG